MPLDAYVSNEHLRGGGACPELEIFRSVCSISLLPRAARALAAPKVQLPRVADPRVAGGPRTRPCAGCVRPPPLSSSVEDCGGREVKDGAPPPQGWRRRARAVGPGARPHSLELMRPGSKDAPRHVGHVGTRFCGLASLWWAAAGGRARRKPFHTFESAGVHTSSCLIGSRCPEAPPIPEDPDRRGFTRCEAV